MVASSAFRDREAGGEGTGGISGGGGYYFIIIFNGNLPAKTAAFKCDFSAYVAGGLVNTGTGQYLKGSAVSVGAVGGGYGMVALGALDGGEIGGESTGNVSINGGYLYVVKLDNNRAAGFKSGASDRYRSAYITLDRVYANQTGYGKRCLGVVVIFILDLYVMGARGYFRYSKGSVKAAIAVCSVIAANSYFIAVKGDYDITSPVKASAGYGYADSS
ncbi:hypothetical protein ES703_103370 [subsurface metagenome]